MSADGLVLLLAGFAGGLLVASVGAWAFIWHTELAWRSSHSGAQEASTPPQDQLESYRQDLQRIPDRMRLTLLTELQALGRFLAERDERHLAQLQVLLKAEQGDQAVEGHTRYAPPKTMASPPFEHPVPVAAPVSPNFRARPSQPEPTPLPRAQPEAEPPTAVPPELSDDEIDALPPELPAPGRSRKRALPPPKKPPFGRL